MVEIAVLSGDGIGPEIIKEAVKVVDAIAEKYNHKFHFEYADFGGAAYDLYGHPFPAKTKKICDRADAILKGPVGGPKYDTIEDRDLRPERGGVLALRKRYDTFANFRPVMLTKALLELSPIRPERIPNGIDIVIVRELTGGIYFGKKKDGVDGKGRRYASDTMKYTENQVERIARIAFKEAKIKQKKLHNIHKSNVLHCSIFWNDIVDKISREFPEVKYENMLVDNAAYQLVVNPAQFNVMLMENMMGDILSDQAAGLVGSLGLMPSACIGPKKSYYEPAHGSAPTIAGKNIANPYSMIGSAAYMLEKSFGLEKESKEIWQALFSALENGYRTSELAQFKGSQVLSTSRFGDHIVKLVLDNVK